MTLAIINSIVGLGGVDKEFQCFLDRHVPQKLEQPDTFEVSPSNPYVKKFFSSEPVVLGYDDYVQTQGLKEGEYIVKSGIILSPKTKSFKDKVIEYFQKKCLCSVNVRREKFKRKIASECYNSKYIDFKPFVKTDDAIDFLKENGFAEEVLFVQRDNPDDLKRLNVICEALSNIHNKTKGKSYMPHSIVFVNTRKSVDGLYGAAEYNYYTDSLVIPRVTDKSKMYITSKSTIYHEIGHANHGLNVDPITMGRYGELYGTKATDARVTYNFLSDTELQTLIMQYMRAYAKTPAEFVADKFKYDMLGTELPEQIHLAAEALGLPRLVGSK